MSISLLKERIENMSKHHQIEVLRILRKFPSVKINENNNGTFINLTEQLHTAEVISELEKYTNYVEEQQIQLKKGEIEKEQIEQHFFNS
jgi:7,8-dihydro-6-hydroxymethylpterin-pyrophosphokinase